jgi:NAD+ synthase
LPLCNSNDHDSNSKDNCDATSADELSISDTTTNNNTATCSTSPNHLSVVSGKIKQFISNYISSSSANGVVIGLSGGLDSSVTLKLTAGALGHTKILGLMLPSDTTPQEDTAHAIKFAESLQIDYHVIDITPIIKKYEDILPASDRKIRGNLMARIRMNLLYYYAGIKNYLVIGTSDKSELLIGYFTKWGDSASDIMPLADLYKTQVRALARYLDIPAEIVEKKSSPRLWIDHFAENEIGMDYETIDSILLCLIDEKKNPYEVAKNLAISPSKVKKVQQMIDSSSHKRSIPKIAYV